MRIPDQYHNQQEMCSHQRNQNLTRLFVVVMAHLQPKFINKKKSDCIKGLRIVINEENITSLCRSTYFRVLTSVRCDMFFCSQTRHWSRVFEDGDCHGIHGP
jgi:hypothetical protein